MPERHVLFFIVPRWGHLRPAIAIAIKLLKEAPDLIITFPIPLSLQQETIDHVGEYLIDVKNGASDNRLRIIPVGPLVHRDKNFYTLVEEFESFYSTLISSQPYIAPNGEVLKSIRPPDVCMMDALHSEAMKTVHRITENVPVFIFSFNSTSLTLRILLRGDVPAQAERLSKETGRSIDEILLEFYQPNKAQLIDIPGLPSVYDYEIVPHLSPIMLAFYLKMGPRSYHSFRQCNGIITTSNWVYEPEGTAALEKYLTETNRQLYAFGPVGLSTPEQVGKGSPDANDRMVIAFLNEILTQRGERSLIYISFGSLFWPPNLDAVWKILEILVQSNTPILLSHNNQRAVMPESLHSILMSSKNVFITPWAPQNAVLRHPVTGWFLTHCGQNSVMEALGNGIPMIAWPIDTDQPLNAVYMSMKLNVAYELIEVRTNNGLKPLHRGITPRGTIEAVEEEFRGILEKLWSSDGQTKRENAQEIQRKFNTLWDEEGESRKDLCRFIADHLA